MIRNFFLILVLIVIINTNRIQLQQMDSFCQNQENNEIVCSGFTDFAQLNLSYFKPSNDNGYSSLVFKPLNSIILDDSLNLINLKVEENYTIEFDSLKGLNLLTNPLAFLDLNKKAILKIKNSKFEIFYENNMIDVDTCNYIIQNELIVPILYTCRKFILDNPLYSSMPICPVLFEGTYLELFQVQDITSNNNFSFIDSSLLNLTNLTYSFDININTFIIDSSDIVLDESILNSFVFAKLSYLSITNSLLRNIQKDLFKSFSFMKVFEVKLYNFKEFIQTAEKNDSWISYLNSNISVDLTNETDFINNRNFKMEFRLTDLGGAYLFPNEDFCIFKNFPHSKLVVPIINTKENLDCTCTLLYLLQYKSLYEEDSFNILETPSVTKCLNDPNFTQLISECDFDWKMRACNGK